MINLARQLTLDLPHEPSYAEEDFLSAPANSEALAAVAAWPQWPGGMLLLTGPSGAGKSHLGAIWAKRAGAATARGETLGKADLVALGEARAVLVDDADLVGEAEAALFHLVNMTRERGASLLLTAAFPPDVWGLAKADLRSRLRLAPLAQLLEPDEALARAVLVKLFADRQLIVEPTVIDYIAPRIDRSLSAARAIVAALDREALARGRAITKPVVSAILNDGATDG
ncbi:MAG TPA: DnaA/Hda family protein [Roseiarcus sp.]|nr:DnaA/Hda family protein [Roseiarcus sp.]